jgi:hypothetical protein
MGRGRTTTGMVCASLVAHVLYGDYRMEDTTATEAATTPPASQGNAAASGSTGALTMVSSNREDGVLEEDAYLNGECVDIHVCRLPITHCRSPIARSWYRLP